MIRNRLASQFPIHSRRLVRLRFIGISMARRMYLRVAPYALIALAALWTQLRRCLCGDCVAWLELTYVVLLLVARACVGKVMRLRAILNHFFDCEGH